LVPYTKTTSEVIARGTLYKGQKNETDITVIHEIHDYKIRRILKCDFALTEQALFETVSGEGEFKTYF
jgi:hypothetical protein